MSDILKELQSQLKAAEKVESDTRVALSPVVQKMNEWREAGRSRTSKDYALRRDGEHKVKQAKEHCDEIKEKINSENEKIHRLLLAENNYAAWEKELVARRDATKQKMDLIRGELDYIARAYQRSSVTQEHAEKLDADRYFREETEALARLDGFRQAMLCQRSHSGQWRPLPGWKLQSEPTGNVRVYVVDPNDDLIP